MATMLRYTRRTYRSWCSTHRFMISTTIQILVLAADCRTSASRPSLISHWRYRVASEAANTARWNGEIPVENKDEYRDPALPAAFWNECLATDPTSNSRTPASLRAPNGVLEDSFYQATGRPLWNAANIYVPTLVIGGDFDTWSFQDDREGLMRALVHAPTKRNVVIKDATHFVLFEKNRMQFFEEILKFMKE